MSDSNARSEQQVAAAAEIFRRSNAACMRSIACDAQLCVELRESSAAMQLGVTTPALEKSNLSNEQAILRGVGDVIAVLGAFHDAQIHALHLPEDQHAAKMFHALERARCESLGANSYKGVRKNLTQLQHDTYSTIRLNALSGVEQLSLVLGCLASEALTGEQTQSVLGKLVDLWRATIESLVPNYFKQLCTVQSDQLAYSKVALGIIEALDVQSLVVDNETEDRAAKPVATQDETSDEQAHSNDEFNDEPAQDNEAQMEQAAADVMREELEAQNDAVQSAADDAGERNSTQSNKDAPIDSEAQSNGGADVSGSGGYTVFSSQFDEVVHAVDLSDETELTELRDKLDQQIQRHSSLVGRLSGRLQRRLMAQQQRHWIFDLDEGHLDTSRLTRLVTQPLSSLSFKAESELRFKDTTITLLLDNSKSMLGKPITIAASCADLLSRTMERCGVSVEILGFTTTGLHGGQSVERWLNSGAAPNPGRLNGLRHIIYKAADVPYRTARKGLGLMLRGDILKQNIDGEALLWAHARISRRSEQRKIIMMISDGAPIDASTMSHNPENYLVAHLHKVIEQIQRQDTVELVAIGIGHDVSVYYERSMTIYDVKKLGQAMLAQLDDLFRDSVGSDP